MPTKNALARYGEMKPSPRNALLGYVADALGSANAFATQPSPSKPGASERPALSLLAELAGLNSLAVTANRLSYGDPLTNAKKANVPFLKPETADALMMAPLSPRTALAALSGGMADTGVGKAMVVWHGSPHKFDKFSAAKIGTGEGAQAYGNGIYLAESKDVADEYAGKLSRKVVDFSNKSPTTAAEHRLQKQLDTAANTTQYGSAWQKVADSYASVANPLPDRLYGNSFVRIKPLPPRKLGEALVMQRAAKRLGQPDVSDMGSLYKVDLPDDLVANMLDWDKPLSQQPISVRNALSAVQSDISGRMPDTYTVDRALAHLQQVLNASVGGGAEDVLRSRGVAGVRYLDGGSRGSGAGTSNFVVFPGNENLLTILERNGSPVR